MRIRLLLIAAVTLTVGFSGSASESRARPDPHTATSFGRGIYTTAGADYARIADLGFRTVIVNPTKTQLDQIRAHGLTAMLFLGGYDSATCTFGWSDETVRARVTAIKDHPASTMYYIADEPHTASCPDAVQQIRARAQLVKSIDPTAATALAENRQSDVTAFANATDVMILSTYPCSHLSGCVLSKIDAAVSTARAANVKHPWGAPQSFGDDYYRVPTPRRAAGAHRPLEDGRRSGLLHVHVELLRRPGDARQPPGAVGHLATREQRLDAPGGFDETWSEPPGRAARPETGSSVAPVIAITGAPCVHGLGTIIAPLRRATFRQTLLGRTALELGQLVRGQVRSPSAIVCDLPGVRGRFLGPLGGFLGLVRLVGQVAGALLEALALLLQFGFPLAAHRELIRRCVLRRRPDSGEGVEAGDLHLGRQPPRLERRPLGVRQHGRAERRPDALEHSARRRPPASSRIAAARCVRSRTDCRSSACAAWRASAPPPASARS